MSPEVTPGWRFVHIGLEREAVQIGGVNVWSLKRGRSPGTIIVAHPSYLGERHAMSVYRIKLSGDRQVVFAAGEFSNGVWGFFEPC